MSEEKKFDIVVNREQFVNRILVPISRFAAKTVISLEGNRLYALANLSSENNGQMFILSDIPMKYEIPEPVEMTLTGVSKMITALRAVSDEEVILRYDGTGLDYRSKKVCFRVRLSSETVAIPFKKDKVLGLKVFAEVPVSDENLREFSSLLSGFPNLNQMQIWNQPRGIVFTSTDRNGVTDELLDYTIDGDWTLGDGPPCTFYMYNYIFRSNSIASLGNIRIRLGAAFAMIVSENKSGDDNSGAIRYIMPKLKVKES